MDQPHRIPDAELEILAVLQRRDGATAREVRERIASWRPLAHSSVMTLLGRLEDRGLVRREPAPEGREFVFHATATREEAVRPILSRLLDRVFEGDPVGLMGALFGTRAPDAREIGRLESLLEEMREVADESGDDRGSRESPRKAEE